MSPGSIYTSVFLRTVCNTSTRVSSYLNVSTREQLTNSRGSNFSRMLIENLKMRSSLSTTLQLANEILAMATK